MGGLRDRCVESCAAQTERIEISLATQGARAPHLHSAMSVQFLCSRDLPQTPFCLH